MNSVLILFATREGQTEKVAKVIAEHLEGAGYTAHLVNAAESAMVKKVELAAYDLLVFGASMHAGGLERELVRFVNANADQIARQAKSMFLVLLSAATRDPELKSIALDDARQKLKRQLALDFEDPEMIAGALVYSKYPGPLKWLMRRIAMKAGEATDTSQDYEYTDWQQVEQYANRLIQMLNQPTE